MALTTDRLLIRSWEESDVPQYLQMARDVGYHAFSIPGQFLVRDEQEAKERILKRIALFRKRSRSLFAERKK